MNTKNEKAVIDDKELEAVTGAGEYIEFADSDDYEHPKTYEESYKYSKKEGFAGREISPIN